MDHLKGASPKIKKISIFLLLILILSSFYNCDLFNNKEGEIYVKSIPSGADVYLDNNFTGSQTYCTLTSVSAGSHQILLVLYGYYDWQTTVEVYKDNQTTVNAVLEDDPDAIVYITESGSKYHRNDCRYLWHSKIAITKGEAIKRGYTKCSVCKP